MTAWPEMRMEFVCTAPAEKGEDGQRWLGEVLEEKQAVRDIPGGFPA